MAVGGCCVCGWLIAGWMRMRACDCLMIAVGVWRRGWSRVAGRSQSSGRQNLRLPLIRSGLKWLPEGAESADWTARGREIERNGGGD